MPLDKSALTVLIAHLDQLDDVGWVYVSSEDYAQKILKILFDVLGYKAKFGKVTNGSYYIELV